MDSLITAAARALATGDILGALKRVALRDDAPALAIRGIAMAQLGDLVRAKALLRRAARAFGPKEAIACARCVVAEAEIALVSRDLGWPAKALDAARATLEARGDHINAAHARNLEARRLLLIGRLDEAERALAEIDPTPLPPASRTTYELVVAGIAIRRLQTKVARAALTRAAHAARKANISALTAEVESASLAMNTPVARLIARGEERLLLLEDVEALLASKALIVDACRHVVREAGVVVSLATRPVLFVLARALGEAWPADVSRSALLARAFRAKHADEFASRAVAGRNRAASHGATETRRRERDEARLCPYAAPRARGGRAGAARRRAACRSARLPRRRGSVVELGARDCARRQSAYRAAFARLACDSGQSPIVGSRPRAALDHAARAGFPDNLVTPRSATE